MSYGSFPAHTEVIEWFLAGWREGCAQGVKRGEETKTFILVLPVKICIFLFPPEIQSNQQQADSTLKASSITNHLQSHAQNIKSNSVTGLVGQINEATQNKVLLNRD